jgi:hypothetical protein
MPQILSGPLSKKTKSEHSAFYGVSGETIVRCAPRLQDLGFIQGFTRKTSGHGLGTIQGLSPEEYEELYTHLRLDEYGLRNLQCQEPLSPEDYRSK